MSLSSSIGPQHFILLEQNQMFKLQRVHLSTYADCSSSARRSWTVAQQWRWLAVVYWVAGTEPSVLARLRCWWSSTSRAGLPARCMFHCRGTTVHSTALISWLIHASVSGFELLVILTYWHLRPGYKLLLVTKVVVVVVVEYLYSASRSASNALIVP